MSGLELLLDFAIIIGLVIVVSMIFILWKKKNRQPSHVILSIFFFFVFITLVSYYSGLHRIPLLYVITDTPTLGINYFLGPLLLLYTRSLFLKIDFKLKSVLIHFLPYLANVILVIIPMIITSAISHYAFTYLAFIGKYNSYFYLVEVAFFLFYAVLSFLSFVGLSNSEKAFYSSVNESDRSWSKVFLIGVIVYLVFDLIASAIGITSVYSPVIDQYLNVLLVVILTILAYSGIRYTHVFLPSYLTHHEKMIVTDDEVVEQTRTMTSEGPTVLLQDEELVRLHKEVLNQLTNRKAFNDPDLTLTDLAASVNSSDKKLSFFINNHLGKSFYELVNEYRIEECKVELLNPEKEVLTIWAIANECGFKSKTSFNRLFKKATSMTPSQFQKKNKA